MPGGGDTDGGKGKANRTACEYDLMVERRLIEFCGKRTGHIESGIMAAFLNGLDAVRAATAIRADFIEYARLTPERALAIGIGLDCGQPIAQGNELVGAPVQLAARIAGIAKPGQVLVSLALREMVTADAPKAAFLPCGAFALSGFEAPVPLYEAGTF